MEAATNIVALHPPVTAPVVRVDGERLVVERLVVTDPGSASFVASRPADERAALVERALRIGLTALADAGVSVNVDVIRREFEAMLSQAQQTNERAARTLEETLRQNFADGDGRLPRTLERFLGDRGALRSFVSELFDETKRDSAIGRMRELLGTYFDGDASRLALLLDPTRLNSPLHAFRLEISEGFKNIETRLVAIEAASTARAAERAKGSAKGTDFEDLLADLLGDICRGSSDLLDRTGTEAGAMIGSKKGDFVITIDPGLTAGAELRVVVEAKDRAISGRAMRDEIRDARANRTAALGLVVFTPAHAPSGIAPFDVRAGDVYCVLDPEAPDATALEAAVRLARLLALVTLREQEVEIDPERIRSALTGVREELEAIRRMKSALTSMTTSARDVQASLDRMREGILTRVAEAEDELRAGADRLARPIRNA